MPNFPIIIFLKLNFSFDIFFCLIRTDVKSDAKITVHVREIEVKNEIHLVAAFMKQSLFAVQHWTKLCGVFLFVSRSDTIVSLKYAEAGRLKWWYRWFVIIRLVLEWSRCYVLSDVAAKEAVQWQSTLSHHFLYISSNIMMCVCFRCLQEGCRGCLSGNKSHGFGCRSLATIVKFSSLPKWKARNRYPLLVRTQASSFGTLLLCVYPRWHSFGWEGG